MESFSFFRVKEVFETEEVTVTLEKQDVFQYVVRVLDLAGKVLSEDLFLTQQAARFCYQSKIAERRKR